MLIYEDNMNQRLISTKEIDIEFHNQWVLLFTENTPVDYDGGHLIVYGTEGDNDQDGIFELLKNDDYRGKVTIRKGCKDRGRMMFI